MTKFFIRLTIYKVHVLIFICMILVSKSILAESDVVYSDLEPVYSDSEPVYSDLEPVYSNSETIYSETKPVYSDLIRSNDKNKDEAFQKQEITFDEKKTSHRNIAKSKKTSPKKISVTTEIVNKDKLPEIYSSIKKRNISHAKLNDQKQTKEKIKAVGIQQETETKDKKKRILSILKMWAQHWSEMNVDSYLSYYAKDFKPSEGISRKKWEKTRKKRLSKKYINIEISNPVITFKQPDLAIVKFKQIYKSNNYNSVDHKKIIMKKYLDYWYILSEK